LSRSGDLEIRGMEKGFRRWKRVVGEKERMLGIEKGSLEDVAILQSCEIKKQYKVS